ncbi:extracellular solute-binding protein [bacterium]|nr:extracellular solute-binding protein [bacterium]MCI0565720.1 extracellular solute-binding protein [bacterium]MCI0679851.1 extracellular solute-binding protein [bacterium]
MKQNISFFQMAMLGVFVAFIIVGVAIFAGLVPIFQDVDIITPEIIVWGTYPAATMQRALDAYNDAVRFDTLKMVYRQKDPATIDAELLEVLAVGLSPDVIFLPHDAVFRQGNKLYPFPYQSMDERTFRDTYIDEGELFLTAGGIAGFPVLVDPLVMYWNKSHFTTAGLVRPPAYWEELIEITPRLTKKDDASNIFQSAVALGEFKNVSYAKDILSLLFFQAGSDIVGDQEGKFAGVLDKSVLPAHFGGNPGLSALQFYTAFVNPGTTIYTWNGALKNSTQAFIDGELSLYFGYASEFSGIKARNPHLNFDVAPVPQSRSNPRRQTYGKMVAASVLRGSPNPSAAFRGATIISGPVFAEILARELGAAPARRDLLAAPTPDAATPVFYDGAIISRGWLDPDPKETETIFRNAVESVISGRATPQSAAGRMNAELTRVLDSVFGYNQSTGFNLFDPLQLINK